MPSWIWALTRLPETRRKLLAWLRSQDSMDSEGAPVLIDRVSSFEGAIFPAPYGGAVGFVMVLVGTTLPLAVRG